MASRKKKTAAEEPAKKLIRVKVTARNHTIHGIAFGGEGELEEELARSLERSGLVEILEEGAPE